jgi:hypothetical protein
MIFLIWSFRKRQWWNANQEGYTDHVKDAGMYRGTEAQAIVMLHGLPGQNLAIDLDTARRFFDGLTADEVESKLDDWRRI